MTSKRRKHGAKAMTDDRLCRWAALSTIRTFRQSAQNGRPISLPNLLRLFQRRCAARAQGGSPAHAHPQASDRKTSF